MVPGTCLKIQRSPRNPVSTWLLYPRNNTFRNLQDNHPRRPKSLFYHLPRLLPRLRCPAHRGSNGHLRRSPVHRCRLHNRLLKLLLPTRWPLRLLILHALSRRLSSRPRRRNLLMAPHQPYWSALHFSRRHSRAYRLAFPRWHP